MCIQTRGEKWESDGTSPQRNVCKSLKTWAWDVFFAGKPGWGHPRGMWEGREKKKRSAFPPPFLLPAAVAAALQEGICQIFVEIVKCAIVKEFLGVLFEFCFWNTSDKCHHRVVQNPVSSSPSFRPKCREFWIFHESFRPLQRKGEIKPSAAQPPFAETFPQQCKQRISHINIRKFQRNV